jgi:hypothetical protein
MTILSKYADLRAWFAPSGAPTAADGFPTWPGPLQTNGSFSNATPSYLRAGGFSASWKVTTAGSTVWNPVTVGPIGPLIAGSVGGGDTLFPLTITINNGATDGAPGADAYAWYLSQRSDGLRYVLADGTLSTSGQPQYFSIAHPADRLHSGTVIVDVVPAQISALFPGSGGVAPTDAASLATLFAHCALYVCRLSDNAFQWSRFVAP